MERISWICIRELCTSNLNQVPDLSENMRAWCALKGVCTQSSIRCARLENLSRRQRESSDEERALAARRAAECAHARHGAEVGAVEGAGQVPPEGEDVVDRSAESAARWVTSAALPSTSLPDSTSTPVCSTLSDAAETFDQLPSTLMGGADVRLPRIHSCLHTECNGSYTRVQGSIDFSSHSQRTSRLYNREIQDKR